MARAAARYRRAAQASRGNILAARAQARCVGVELLAHRPPPAWPCHASAMASAAARYRRAAQASSCDLPAVGALRRGPSNVGSHRTHGGHRAVTARSSMFSTASSRAFSIHTMSSPLIFALSWLPPSSYCYCHTLASSCLADDWSSPLALSLRATAP